jgi:hypothetical protein
VKEHKGRGREGEVVEFAPQRASDAMAQKRREEDKQHKIKCSGSGKVELRL